jgi:transcriptional regulator with XRE-family HTH domain
MGVKSALSQEEVKAILSRIEERLVVLGMSKEEFYAKSGVSSATYSYWNTNRYKPTPKKLRNAAEVLEVSYEYLVTGEGQKNKPALPQENELDDELVELLTELRPDEVQLLVAYAQGIIAARKNS